VTTSPLTVREQISLLVVEDEAIVARDLELTLHSLGYYVAGSAADAAAAVLAAERMSPDLVLMDIRLRGGSDGVAAAQEIWRRFSIPVIFLTAYSDDETIGRAQSALPFGFIVKPYLAQQLRPAIEIAVHKVRSERELRTNYSRLHDALEDLADAVILADCDGQLRWANGCALRMLGETPGSLGSRRLEDLLPENHATAIATAGQGALRRRDGELLAVEFGIAPLQLDGAAIAIVTFRLLGEPHKTAPRVSEADFGRVVNGLADHVRTPLQALSSTLDLFELSGNRGGAHSDSLPLLRRQVDRVREVIHLLTQFADGEEPDLHPVMLSELLEETLREVESLALRRQVKLRVGSCGTSTVQADRDRLVAALVRIVENAVQFTPGGGEVRITVELSEEERLRIFVDDDGPGFPAAELPRIFEPFFSRRPGGTGMGLSLALRIAECHGGAVAATNRAGGGARITVDLPGVYTP
jgi:signal transduction histidine kinase